MEESIWVGLVWPASAATRAKLAQLHGLTEGEVRDAVQQRRGLAGDLGLDKEGRLRALLNTRIRGRPALVVLYPVNGREDCEDFRIGSAYFLD